MLESRSLSVDVGFRNSNLKGDSRFLELYSEFQSPGLRIPQANWELHEFRSPESLTLGDKNIFMSLFLILRIKACQTSHYGMWTLLLTRTVQPNQYIPIWSTHESDGFVEKTFKKIPIYCHEECRSLPVLTFGIKHPFQKSFIYLVPWISLTQTWLKLIIDYCWLLLFHRSRRGFPSLLRYGQRRRVTDTVVLVFFSLVPISKYMLFLVYVWTARSHRGAFAAFPKKWKMPDKCPPLRILLPSGGGRMRTYTWNCDWPIKLK